MRPIELSHHRPAPPRPATPAHDDTTALFPVRQRYENVVRAWVAAARIRQAGCELGDEDCGRRSGWGAVTRRSVNIISIGNCLDFPRKKCLKIISTAPEGGRGLISETDSPP